MYVLCILNVHCWKMLSKGGLLSWKKKKVELKSPSVICKYWCDGNLCTALRKAQRPAERSRWRANKETRGPRKSQKAAACTRLQQERAQRGRVKAVRQFSNRTGGAGSLTEGPGSCSLSEERVVWQGTHTAHQPALHPGWERHPG